MRKANLKTLLTILAFLLVMVVLLSGARAVYGNTPKIMLISDCSAPGTYTGTPPNDVNERDNTLVWFLEDLGYIVDTSGMNKAYQGGQNPFGNPAKVAALNAADLVLVSRHSNSIYYDNDRQDWNELEKPLLLMNGYLTRGGSDNRWGWTTGGGADAALTETDIVIEAGQMEHPLVAGFTSPITAFDWSLAPTPGQAPKALFLPDSPPVAGADVIGTFDSMTILMDIPAGTDFDANNTDGPYGVAGGRRALLATWGYDIYLIYEFEPWLNRDATFTDFLTEDYLDLFAQTLSVLASRDLIIYVDDDAPSGGDGLSWATAFKYLQDGLRIAWSSDEIRVAEGIYKPDANAAEPSGSGDQTETFELKTGVAIYGGYAGLGEPDPNTRDPNIYETILCGDIGTVDVNTDNSYHVVTSSMMDKTAVLDGFTITGGNANGTYPNDRGGGMYNSNSSSPTVTNCTFSGNYAAGSGGGMFNYQSSPTVTGCKYILNQTDFHGGGIYNQLCSPRVINCVFSQNMAAVHGGGMMNNDYSYPTVVECTFSQNTAGASGGGMTNSWFSSSTVTNCTFTNNTATAGGGGIYLYASSLTATNCTFSGNTAYSGGGMFNKASSPIVTDCNFSKNTAQSFAGGGMYNHTGSNPIVTNCSFTGNTAANDGGGIYNVDSSPTITNCTFSGNSVYYCGGGIYNLNSSSPFVTNCTFFGNSVSYGGGSYGGGMYNKNSSNPTVTNCIFWNDLNSEIRNIDSSPIFTYSDIQGGTGQLWFGTGCIDADPCFVDAESGDFRPKAGSPCIDAGNNNALPINIMTDLDGKPRFRDDANMPDTGFGTPPIVDMGAYEKQGSPIHNVTQGNYYLHIQQAINDANNGDEIEVAPGTYYEAINFSGKEVRLYSSWGPQATTIDANGAYHVVQCVSGENANTILEGFTITGGNANGGWPDHAGGGMYNSNSSPTVTNCNFSGNTADYGGGMSNDYSSSPIVTNCTFSMNTATERGGGMYNDNSSPTVTNCTFSSNSAGDGGGMSNIESSPTVTNCTFSGNTAGYGGGMSNIKSSPTVTNCTFTDNSTEWCGGGMYNFDYSNPIVTNCTFSGNSADYGGGMYNFGYSNPIVTNCNFRGNSAKEYGGGMSNIESSPIVTNCIFWNDTPDEIYNILSTPTVTYSDIQGGGYPDANNINADPCFIDANSGDLRLKPNSPCIDAGNNTAVPSSVLKDLAGKLRFADDPYTPDTGNAGTTGRPVVDMGAYEFQGCGAIPQNLLANPGFELGNATGWITNWGWSLTATAEQVHDGNYSGLVSGRADSWQGAWQSLLGLMDDGKTYRISGWVRLQNATSNYVALTVKKVDSTGDHYYGIDNATAYSDSWVNLDGTLNFDANESMTDLYIYFEGPAADVNFYVDDAAVTEVMGDMDHSGGIDFIDFALFASYYGFDCSTQDCGRANLDDNDNTINERDLAILCNNWLAGTEP